MFSSFLSLDYEAKDTPFSGKKLGAARKLLQILQYLPLTNQASNHQNPKGTLNSSLDKTARNLKKITSICHFVRFYLVSTNVLLLEIATLV